MTQFHGMSKRSPETLVSGQIARFGRLFPGLSPSHFPEDGLRELAAAMKDTSFESTAGDNRNVPAGFTYLGQFIDHDITLDTTSLSAAGQSTELPGNFRTPKLDLDCLYGSGPEPHPFLYTRRRGGAGPKLVIGTTSQVPGKDTSIPVGLPNDLPRSVEGFPIIGDPRNDENLNVSQLQLAMLKFHNKIVDRIAAQHSNQGEQFEEAQRLTRWHYQWVIVHDFLPRILDQSVLNDVLTNGRRFYTPSRCFIPVEFSVAAYRLGHSMVRESYTTNRIFQDGVSGRATLKDLFTFSGLLGDGTTVPIPSERVIDWNRFFELDDSSNLNFSRNLDPFTVPSLHTLPLGPGEELSLPFRNLLRSQRVGLPSAQRVVARMSMRPLQPSEIATGPDGQVAAQHGFHNQTPLWYYILKEAQIQANGKHLGQVGSRLVAEVFIGLLETDPTSYLGSAPEWTPQDFGTNGNFTMADLLRFVDDINPLG